MAPKPPSNLPPAASPREARLAAALRENLHRRKAQARARAAGAQEPAGDPPPPRPPAPPRR